MMTQSKKQWPFRKTAPFTAGYTETFPRQWSLTKFVPRNPNTLKTFHNGRVLGSNTTLSR